MPSLHEPHPHEELPPGWGGVDDDDDRVSFRHYDPQVELCAVPVPADRSHPTLGLCRCWELRFCYPVGECSATERLGRVPTRTAAVDGLLECIEYLYETVGSPEDPHDVCTALESMPLRSAIPERSSIVR